MPEILFKYQIKFLKQYFIFYILFEKNYTSKNAPFTLIYSFCIQFLVYNYIRVCVNICFHLTLS